MQVAWKKEEPDDQDENLTDLTNLQVMRNLPSLTPSPRKTSLPPIKDLKRVRTQACQSRTRKTGAKLRRNSQGRDKRRGLQILLLPDKETLPLRADLRLHPNPALPAWRGLVKILN